MILENYRQTTDYKPQTVKETAKQNKYSDKRQKEFLTPRKTVNMILLNNIPQFASPNRFDALRMTTDNNDKESDEQLIQNKTELHPPKSISSKLKLEPQQQLCLETLLKKQLMAMLSQNR